MRAVFDLACRGRVAVRNYHVTSAIYAALNSRMDATSIHDRGFEYGGRRYRLFTFAVQPGRDGKLRLVVASPVPGLVSSLFEAVTAAGSVRLGMVRFHLASASLEEIEVQSDSAGFRTLSPIVVTQASPETGTVYLLPNGKDRDLWCRLVEANLLRKYAAFLTFAGAPAEGEPWAKVEVERWRPVIVRDRLTFLCAGVEGVIRGRPDVVRFAFAAGLGGKGGMGFGCIETT